MSSLPWFRIYHRMVDDERLRLLAFEDRWHFVAVLCLKADGLIDDEHSDLWERRLAVKLGVQLRELDEIHRRLMAVGLIDADWQPCKWDELQCRSDSSAERTRKHRARKKEQEIQSCDTAQRHSDVTVTPQIREDKIREDKKEPPKPPRVVRKPDGVSDEVWADWKRVRRRPITETVLKRMETEAAKVGWTLAQAIIEAAESGWQGFKAEYVKDRKHENRNSADGRDGVAKALDRRLGLGQPAGEAGRFDPGGSREGGGDTIARLADLR